MDVESLKLASMFAMKPNSLGFCGRDDASAKLYDCVVDGHCEDVQYELTKFIALYPYLRTISEITGDPIFSYEVVKAYWLGSDILKTVSPKDFDILLKNFLKQGIPKSFVETLGQNRPKEFIPFHLFQVLSIGVGKLSGAVPFNIKTINNCMVRWGMIKDINENQVTIDLNSLTYEGNKYDQVIRENIVAYDPKFVKQIGIGQNVAVHWNMIVKTLDANEVDDLSYWTNRVLENVNETAL